jgi:hypothetical protein
MIASFLLLTSIAAASSAPQARPYWLKTYSLAPYRETWTGEISVKKLDAALPEIVAAVEKSGGRLTQPLANFVGSSTEQQLSLTVPFKKAKTLLAALRKIGKILDPAVRSSAAAPPLEEVQAKLARLTKEKNEKWGALAQTPAAAEAVDEIIAHLADVEAVARSTDGDVLWNVTVKEAR